MTRDQESVFIESNNYILFIVISYFVPILYGLYYFSNLLHTKYSKQDMFKNYFDV